MKEENIYKVNFIFNFKLHISKILEVESLYFEICYLLAYRFLDNYCEKKINIYLENLRRSQANILTVNKFVL